MKTITRGLLAFAVAACLEVPAYSQTLDREYNLEIERQPLAAALTEFSKQTGLQIGYFPETLTENIYIGPISGRYTAEAAIAQLLLPSGLSFERLNERTIAVTGREAAKAQRRGFSTMERRADDGSAVSFVRLANLRLAAAEEEGQQTRTAANARESDDGKRRRGALEEVIVTAQKREERLQDVPVPVAAISADVLLDSNQLRLEDYYSKVPALNYTTDFRGGATLSIRGISSGIYGNPTIGIVVDDVPYGASTSLGGGFAAPDFDPSDLERIEVLRGPQGTLYGANSVGGLFKYVTIDPSTEGVSGRVQAGLSSVHDGDEPGYNVRGSINLPLGDTWAIRASGFLRQDPGYIDNPVLGLDDLNKTDADGGRLSVLWRPSEDLSLKLSAHYQSSDRRGSAEVDLRPGMEDLQQNYPRGTGTYKSQTRMYSAIVKAKLGSVDLTSLSGYGESSILDNPNYPAWVGFSEGLFGVSGASLPEELQTKKYTQEIRFSMPIGQKIEWRFGSFYTYEDTFKYFQEIVAIDPVTGIVAGSLLEYDAGPTTYEELAGFTDLRYQVTDRFDIQIGGRQSHNKQSHDERGVYGAFGGFVFDPPKTRSNANSFTYSVTPRFKVSQDLMLYARVATGYRAGGPNYLTSATNFPLEFQPDKTNNYEIGVKGDVLDHALSYDASVYYIDWKDLQVLVGDPASGLTGYANAGRAESQGVELSVEASPLKGLAIVAWVAWNDAVMTEDFPQGGGFSGDRLPFSSRFSGNLSLEQEFPIANSMTGFAGASVSYVDDRAGSFSTGSQEQQIYPSYVHINLLAGLRHESWMMNVFVNNLADKRGILMGDPVVATSVSYIQPRTIGLSFSRNF